MLTYGKIRSMMKFDNGVTVHFEQHSITITCLSEDIINIFTGLRYADHFSNAVIPRELNSISISTQQYTGHINIETATTKITVADGGYVDFFTLDGTPIVTDYRGTRSGFIRHGANEHAHEEGHLIEKNTPDHLIEIVKSMQGDEYFYGLGDKTGFLNKRGYAYEMWNTDDPTPHVDSHKALYKSVPFLLTVRNQGAFGLFFDNTFRSFIDLGKENTEYYYFSANDGNIDYYFINGPKSTDVLTRYTYLTGRSPLPQRWTLGYQQSRWSYENEERVKTIVEQFHTYDIPLDVIHLDIDYMDAFKVFTWHPERFPNPQELLADLAKEGVKVVTIIDPALKKERGYFAFDQALKANFFATDKDGLIYINKVWPGAAAFPDFSHPDVREWWANHVKTHALTGVAGIWNDMNEPASFEGELPLDVQFNNNGRPSTHAEIHNVYGHFMCEATYNGLKAATNRRPFVITRGAYAGTQRYTTFWTGDNHSFWDHLQLAIPQQLNLGMSGFSLVGTDVGGFGSDTTAELLIRWTQLGAFSPLFRNHSSVMTRSQEPFAFDETTMVHVRDAIRLRYRLLPYFYDLLWAMQHDGLPILRALSLHYQNDAYVKELNSQFLVGASLLVAPIIEQGMRERIVYLPEGNWYDYWSGELYKGENSHIVSGKLHEIPMYIREGTIIPHYPVQRYVGEQTIINLILDIVPGIGTYIHYEDDGESFDYEMGMYNETRFDISENMVHITAQHCGYTSTYETYTCTIIGVFITTLFIDNCEVSFEQTSRGVKFTTPVKISTIKWI